MSEKQWGAYLLECVDGTLYCGATNDIESRVKRHNTGKGARYTKTRLPVSLLLFISCTNKSEAMKLEYRIKQMTRNDKLKLIKEHQ